MSNKVHQGHLARKRFGQNFLQDQGIIDQIVAAIDPRNEDHLVEIGPGLGALTEPVASKVDQLQVVELDRDLAKRLVTNPLLAGKLTIHQGDALKFDFSSLAKDGQKLKIFGNLPYNISTPLMFHLFEQAKVVENMHFMLQKEVVLRLTAAPGTKSYGRLSVMAQYFCQIIPVCHVGPEAFVPPPKVDSAVVRLVPYQELPHPAKDLECLRRICTEAFSKRRKTIRNSLKGTVTVEELEQLGIRPELRPEQISMPQYVAIANHVSSR